MILTKASSVLLESSQYSSWSHHYYFTLCEYFTPAFQWSLRDSKSLQVSKDSFRFFDQSQQFCSLNDFDSSSDFQQFQSDFQYIGNRSKWTNYNFHSMVQWDGKINYTICFPFCLLSFTHLSFSHQLTLMVFHRSLSDSKSPQVSRTLLSILAVLNNVVVCMVSTRLPTSKSFSSCSNPLVTVPNAPITIGIILTCMFHSFFQFPSKVEVLILLSTFFQFCSVVSRDSFESFSH